MARQARAEATRQRIIDTAVELFTNTGYGETGLAEILQRADITKGAFYYHFDSKEAVAAAIIDDTYRKIAETAMTIMRSSAPALENIIRATFAAAELMATDPMVQVGKLLAQSLTQVSDRGPKVFLDATALFVAQAHEALVRGDLRTDVDVDDVGESIWATVLGCYLLSDAIGDDVMARLARGWRVLLGGVVRPESLPYYRDFVARTYQVYAHAPLTAQ